MKSKAKPRATPAPSRLNHRGDKRHAVCGVRSPTARKNAKPVLHTAHHSQHTTGMKAKPKVQVTAMLENVDNGTFAVELAFRDVGGRRRRIRIPCSDLLSASALHKQLVDHGAALPTDKKEAAELLEGLDRTKPPIKRITRRTGWHGDTFVLPRASLGAANVSFDLRPAEEENVSRGARSGTLRDWKEGLREALAASDYLVFALGLALAAPLGALAGLEETAVFHTYGESNSGKTLMQKVAISTLGRAWENDLPTFNQTRIGAQDLMAEFNGMLVTLNEMASAEADPKALKAFLVDLPHVLTSGVGRNRSRYSKRDADLQPQTWNAFGMTNKEESLEKLAKDAGKRRMPGERARFIDVPVPPRAEGGIFNRLSGDGSTVQRNAARLAQVADATIKEHFGVAMPVFIKRLVEHRERELRRFKRNSERFANTYAPPEPWEQRFARKLGFSTAGGLAGVDAGVMPCSRRRVIEANRAIYRAARACFETDMRLKDQALQTLLDHLNDDQAFPRIEKNERAPESFATSFGFRRKYPGLGECLCVRGEVFGKWAGTDEAFKAVITHLKRIGAHVPGKDKSGLTQVREVRNGGRRRYVMLRLPVLQRLRSEAASEASGASK